ncbi:MAG: hypothetical protein COZ91_01875 [Candidatus Nealsonbacteria bacterium CG_4_8_14_3_um_filter_39_7]|uniref:Type II toxin-antitoxin system antitoxin, RelB/DinJ family n=1 Tax=Candidatus Nealsonbacteria bacterium CG23_combo_of_CG06-09_8_20_14_all_39_17 TaxID=1974722 RepID=A0A2G9YUC8_9BACT|nr:MAG: hypothetical protein COX37_01795 [Candidatus Nealsonbacteria bacterium CG23_combo_of_CG06-09_8_20_14_all_39_17]PIU44123.1 MAG: hypothetical protein COS96_00575 [Candidatus Nealsonbacteria bacterium CG07_land_8_20_14_0_80_39_13]PIW91173.1 MAG: hypothetical protein COZ91_01875 [Candidatus Nealsonbacteria bacterium CG_4_8_14_3_um_filter_39_7]
MKTVINVKTDKDVKENAQRIATTLGFSLSAIINANLKQFIRNKEVYFDLAPRMSPELEKLLGIIESDIDKNKNISRAFTSENEIKKHLSSL